MTAEHPAAFWSVSFHFDDWDLAGKAYEASRDVIFGLDIDASAYRILLNGQARVVVVGSGIPAPALIERFHLICQQGEDSPIPDEVVLTLALRHEQFRTPNGTKFERRGIGKPSDL